MNWNVVTSTVCCLIWISLSGLSVTAQTSPQPVERGSTETAKSATQKSRPAPRTAAAKSPSKSPAKATAKATNKPGKRFWARIMDVFRDVHSVEKKPNK